MSPARFYRLADPTDDRRFGIVDLATVGALSVSPIGSFPTEGFIEVFFAGAAPAQGVIRQDALPELVERWQSVREAVRA